jgi:hypothetical protein
MRLGSKEAIRRTYIIRVSDVIVSDILDSDHLPIIFHIQDHVKIRNLSEPIEKFKIGRAHV